MTESYEEALSKNGELVFTPGETEFSDEEISKYIAKIIKSLEFRLHVTLR